MLTQDEILSRAQAYACCALSEMASAVRAWDRGETLCGDEHYDKATWLGLFAAPVMYDASKDGTCETPAFAQLIADYADCICNVCGCDEPAAADCTINVDYTVLNAVDFADLPVSPADGDSYYILSGTNVGAIATWTDDPGGFSNGFSNGFDI